MKSFNTLFLLLLIVVISSCSKDDPVSPTQSGIPSKPKNLTPKNEDSLVVLKWETPDNTGSPIISKYLIYRKSGNSNYENIAFSIYNTTTYKDTSTIILNSYSYYITAINTNGESERSNEISATPYPFGTNSSVYSVAVNGNDVYVGGEFTTAGGVSANKIAKLNGVSWTALSNGLNNDVYSIAINENDVNVGGNFNSAGGVSVSNIARWNGTSWSALGSGLNNRVFSVAVNGNDVYVGGEFTTAGGVSVSNIAKWNGTS